MKKTKTLSQQILTAMTGAAALLLVSSAAAATFNWTNTSSGAFLNAANWTNTAAPFANGVPGAADSAVNNITGSTTTIGTGDTIAVTTYQSGAGALLMTDGVLNTANLQVIGAGSIAQSGGAITTTTDSRLAANNAIWTASAGTWNLSKMVIGSATGVTNTQVIVSGTAIVNQDQTGSTRELWIGGNNGGFGSLTLKDSAFWANLNTAAGIVSIGRGTGGSGGGTGTFTIQDAASFNYGNVVQVANNGTATIGTVYLNGGTITVSGFNRGTGTGTINVNGGAVTASAANTNFFSNFTGAGGSNSVNLVSGSLKFDTAGLAVTISNVLSGAGGLIAQGNSTLTLAASNTYTGPTVVNNGTLMLVGSGSINSSASIALNGSSTLDVSASSQPLSCAGALLMTDSTLTSSFLTTNMTVGTFGTTGSANTLNITTLPGATSLPLQIKLIKYTTAAAGLVDANNVLTTLGVILPTLSSPQGYLTNNAANKSIDLVITNMVLGLRIAKQPAPDSAYAGGFAHFTVELERTNSPSYQWRKGGVPLSNGGRVSGATTAVLKIRGVSAADIGAYDVVVTNVASTVTSSAATLTLLAPIGYEAAAVAAGPVALYMFDETGDPATNNTIAFDFESDLDGVYGVAAQNGNPNYSIAGPIPSDGFANFAVTNLAVHFLSSTPESHVTIPPLNLNTNTVTLAAWINPGSPVANAGVIFCRGAGGTIAGMNFTGSIDANGNRTLGYTWNNEAGTYNWNSQIAPPSGQWSLAALVITPTNAAVYIINTNGLLASVHDYPHVNQTFSDVTLIGEDGVSDGNRQFDGSVDGVAVYAKALTQSQLEVLYGGGVFSPKIYSQPASQDSYEHQTVSFAVGASGTQPLSYQWQTFDGANYLNVTDNARISGSTTTTLTVSNLVLTDAANFVLVVTNIAGSITSSVAFLTVNSTNPPEAITNSTVLTGGQDWETPGAWSDGNPASLSAASKPGSTYHVVAGGGLRTPNTTASTNFPGEILTVYGDGVYNAGAVTTMGALIMKGQSPGITSFKKLVMNGGQILSFTDNNNPTVIGGDEVSIVANTPIAGLSATGGRSYTISAKLTGNGTVDYIGWANTTFQPGAVTALNIAGTNNTFTGRWNVEAGTLVGSYPGALGTNSITVGVNGAFQATYSINNPKADLNLNGQMNLSQNAIFNRVFINGAPLPVGTYTRQQLAAAGYAANFSATWTGQTGAESFTTAVGTLTALTGPGPQPGNMGISYANGVLQVTWTNTGLLLEATNVTGPWTTNFGAGSPLMVTNPSASQQFFRVLQQ